jgi:hypothetical protein
MTLARSPASRDTAGSTTCTFLQNISAPLANIQADTTYVLAGIPRLTIGATSLGRWAVSPLVVGITAFSQLGMVRGKVFVMIEALLRFQVSVSRNVL